MRKLITLRHALEDRAWLGSMMSAPSFRAIRILLIAAMGEPLEPDELATFAELTGRPNPPVSSVEELWIIAGRRSGKSLGISVLAAYLSACVDWRDNLARGERGTLPILAASTTQANTIFNYMRGHFHGNPEVFVLWCNRLGGRHSGVTSDTIALRNRIDVSSPAGKF